MTSTTRVRDQDGREWRLALAPEPPSNLDGKLRDAFPVTAQAVETIHA